MLFRLALRVIFVLLALAVGLGLRRVYGADVFPAYAPWLIAGLAAALVSVELVFQRRHLRTAVAAFIGLTLGVLVTVFFTAMFILLLPPRESPEDVGIVVELWQRLQVVAPFVPIAALFICYLTITIVMGTKEQFRFILPYMDLSHQGKPGGGLLLDTSALIDGRLVELAVLGLTDQPLTVPAFVIGELQALADSADKGKRNRGRRGLDMLNRLQDAPEPNVVIHHGEVTETEAVDEKLVLLARGLDAKLVTADSNLVRVARVHGIPAINVHEMMREMRPPAVHGDALTVDIVKPGEQPGQGIGYLDDGTMVVVEGARSQLGQEVSLVVTSSLQTPAGRMLFGRLRGAGGPTPPEGTRRGSGSGSRRH